MKTKLSLLLGAFSLVSITGAIAQTAVTDPVGYVTMQVAGNGSANSPARSYVGATLVNKIDFTGSVVSVAGTSITFAASSFADGAFNRDLAGGNVYYVEVTSGTNQGVWTDIVSNTTSALVTSDNISSLIASGASVKIRKHQTIASVFGANNEAGLASGIDISTADELQILNAETQNATTIFFSTDDLNPGWITAAGGPAGNLLVPPGVGVKISRKSSAPLPIVQVGHVKLGPTWLPVEQGVNVITVPLATGTTFDASGLTPTASSGVAGGIDISSADEVGFLSSGAFTNNFFSTDDLNPGWVTAGGSVAASTPLPEGSAVRIVRKTAATNWIAPAQAVSTN